MRMRMLLLLMLVSVDAIDERRKASDSSRPRLAVTSPSCIVKLSRLHNVIGILYNQLKRT